MEGDHFQDFSDNNSRVKTKYNSSPTGKYSLNLSYFPAEGLEDIHAHCTTLDNSPVNLRVDIGIGGGGGGSL